MIKEFPTVGDLLRRVRYCETPGSVHWLDGLDSTFFCLESFYNSVLTIERVRLLLSDLSVLIMRTFLHTVAHNRSIFGDNPGEVLRRGSLLLEAVRQQAVGLGVDADVIERRIS